MHQYNSLEGYSKAQSALTTVPYRVKKEYNSRVLMKHKSAHSTEKKISLFSPLGKSCRKGYIFFRFIEQKFKIWNSTPSAADKPIRAVALYSVQLNV